MKLLLSTAILISLSFSTFGQIRFEVKNIFDLDEEEYVDCVFILEDNMDETRTQIFKKLGKPYKDKYGIVNWKNVNISQIGSNLRMKLFFGYATKMGQIKRIDKFKSEKEMRKITSKLKDDQEMLLYMSFYDENGNPVELNGQKIEAVRMFLNSL